MSDCNNIDTLAGEKRNSIFENKTVYEFAIKLKEIIQKRGVNQVWALIDDSFKRKESSEKIKTLKNRTKITKETFRKDVTRFVNEKQKNAKMSFSVKGNILLLLHVMEILGIKNLSDFLNVPYKNDTIEHFTCDTNKCVQEINQKLDGIENYLKNINKKKPRFIINKVSNDWFDTLTKFNELLFTMKNNVNVPNNPNINQIDIYFPNTWYNFYLDYFDSIKVKFVIKLIFIFNYYQKYFFNDKILNNFKKNINSLEKKNYRPDDNLFILSPLYALYFLVIMYKRYFFSLSSVVNRNKMFRFINSDNIDAKNVKRLVLKKNELRDNNDNPNISIESISLKDVLLGEYIDNQIKDLYKKIKNILDKIINNDIKLKDSYFDQYFIYLNNIFFVIYEMNLIYTKIDSKWLSEKISKIDSLNDLYREMSLGISNISIPSINHIDKIDSYIKEFNGIGDELDRYLKDKYE